MSATCYHMDDTYTMIDTQRYTAADLVLTIDEEGEGELGSRQTTNNNRTYFNEKNITDDQRIYTNYAFAKNLVFFFL